MKIFNTVILSLAIGFLIIGIHQSLTVGFEASYWIFMISLSLILWFKIRKNKKADSSIPDKKKTKKNQKDKGRN
ncbi:hypothetical protein BH23BAC1_BH23BAC1_02300 [soil metagenome]